MSRSGCSCGPFWISTWAVLDLAYGPFLPLAWAVLVHGPFWYRPINSNLGPILHRFGDTADYWSKNRQNRQFVPTPVSEIVLARGDPYRIS